MTGVQLKGKRILITSGPTCVAIDQMRVITNRATGELGYLLAKGLSQNKAKVTLLQGPVEFESKLSGVKIKKFYFFNELVHILNTELQSSYDIVIHNAAVSDFQLKKPFTGKLDSRRGKLNLELIPTPKLINQIKLRNKNVKLVGFKLEDFKNEKQIIKECAKLMQEAQCDWVIANTLKGGYKAYLINKFYSILSVSYSKIALAKNLINVLKESV